MANRFYLTFPFTLDAGTSVGVDKISGIKMSDLHNKVVSVNASIGLLYQAKKRLLLSCSLPALASISYVHAKYQTFTNGVVSSTSSNKNFTVTGNLGASTNIAVGVGFLIR